MSLYLEWTNKIKTLATSQWLTHSQRDAFERVSSGWKSHRYVGLAGAKGSGKSFIARLLEKEAGFLYARHLDEIEVNTANIQVVLDDRPYSRTDQALATSLGLARVVFVDRQKPRDQIPCAHLVLDPTDVEEFQHTLYRHRIVMSFTTKPSSADLEQILVEEATSKVGRA